MQQTAALDLNLIKTRIWPISVERELAASRQEPGAEERSPLPAATLEQAANSRHNATECQGRAAMSKRAACPHIPAAARQKYQHADRGTAALGQYISTTI